MGRRTTKNITNYYYTKLVTILISPLFCKKGTNRKILILQEKQEGGSFSHITDDLRGRIYPVYLVYS